MLTEHGLGSYEVDSEDAQESAGDGGQRRVQAVQVDAAGGVAGPGGVDRAGVGQLIVAVGSLLVDTLEVLWEPQQQTIVAGRGGGRSD